MGLFKRDRQEPAEGGSPDESQSPAADRQALARQWREQGAQMQAQARQLQEHAMQQMAAFRQVSAAAAARGSARCPGPRPSSARAAAARSS
jgi:hypothetical protein